jgi:RNA polymerase sigma factor (sigma-70 family)
MLDRPTEDLLRELAPRVLGAVVRRYGHFDTAEDAVQEALLAAARQWPAEGVPDNPRAWLIRVAARRLTDLLRADQARRGREEAAAAWPVPAPGPATDDSLVLLFMCCHPALSPASQIALTLRAVGGLTTTEVARAFLVPEDTMTRRITRAKKSIKDSGVPFGLPPPAERAARLAAVRHVLYLIFNEGYVGTSGPSLQRVELSTEAIRLARMLHRLLPDDAEATGLLALMLLTDARRPARTAPDGTPVPMAEQDRSRWNRTQIAEGVALLSDALPRGDPGPYQIQAAIAALHDEAPRAEDTDWPQITMLYEILLAESDNPVVALNHAVAVAMARGPEAGLALLEPLGKDDRLAADHRWHMARAHLLEMSGDREGARAAYLTAATKTMSPPQQRYLHTRAARLG